jgi:L-rhamnose isomerase/sugar isomerase
MKIQKQQLLDINNSSINSHKDNYNFLANQLTNKGYNVESIVSRLAEFQVAIPSWALGAGGTRFGRFSFLESLLTWNKRLRM